MLTVHRLLASALLSALLLGGCADQTLVKRLDALEQRVHALELKLADLAQERRPPPRELTDVPAPHRSAAEIRAHIRQLEAEKAKLSTKYTPEHPTIVDLERQIRMLQRQLELSQKKGVRLELIPLATA